jgi:putative chitobiose transport system substrate-binding protein
MYVAGIEDYDELRRALVKAVEAGVTGRQDIQQALDSAVAIWNRKLNSGSGLNSGPDLIVAREVP